MNEDQTRKWHEDMQRAKDEPLHPDLEEYIEESEVFGSVLKHPLVFQIPLTLPGFANTAYEAKTKALDRAVEENNLHSIIWIHERPYRTEALVEYVVGRDEDDAVGMLVTRAQEIRDLAADVWVDSENLHQHVEEWTQMFEGWEPGNPLILGSEEEQAQFATLPEVLTVYRGDIDDGGWSWTLDPKVAGFFAHRFGADAPLIQGRVAKRQVFGYLTRRNESEVLVAEGAVYDVEPYQEK